MTAASQIGALRGRHMRVLDAFAFLRYRAPVPEIVLVVIDERLAC